MTPIEELAIRQLAAYNRADLDAFCACFHPQVQVWDGEVQVLTGHEAFRQRYAATFARGRFGAAVDQRLISGVHCVDREQYWVDGAEGRTSGEVLVRYRLVDDTIGVVQFLR